MTPLSLSSLVRCAALSFIGAALGCSGSAGTSSPQADTSDDAGLLGGGAPHADAGTTHPRGTDAGPAASPDGAPSLAADAALSGDAAVSGDAAISDDAAAPPPGTFWTPSNATPLHLHWQLSTTFDYPNDVVPGETIYDIDGETNTAATVAALHALGPDVKVICYVDVGTWEDYRSDASQFPASVIGNTNGWPGEKWLDARQQAILLPLMKNRFVSWCQGKGFDAIEPDNLDAWENSSGFPLTEADNISYDLAIAALAHSLGLSVGLKNLPENAPSLEPSFDWALDEQCYQYQECSYYQQSFLAKGKAVFDVEYGMAPNCADANAAHMNAVERDLDLVGPNDSGYVYQPCVPDSQTTWP